VLRGTDDLSASGHLGYVCRPRSVRGEPVFRSRRCVLIPSRGALTRGRNCCCRSCGSRDNRTYESRRESGSAAIKTDEELGPGRRSGCSADCQRCNRRRYHEHGPDRICKRQPPFIAAKSRKSVGVHYPSLAQPSGLVYPADLSVGRASVKRAPTVVVSAFAVPPWASAATRTIARPSPAPGLPRAVSAR
jgi:hypothetical protein